MLQTTGPKRFFIISSVVRLLQYAYIQYMTTRIG